MPEKVAPLIAFAVIVGCQVLFVSGMIMRVVDRRALRRGTVAAFRRGVVIASTRGRFRSAAARQLHSIQTALGSGQWLTDNAFGFWGRENYLARSQYFAWVGLCTVEEEEAVFEVHLLRSSVLVVAAIVSWLLVLAIGGSLLALTAGGFLVGGFVLGGVALIAWIIQRAFRRERACATDIMEQLRERFERV